MTNTEKFTLRDYQLQVIKETYQYFRNGIRSLLIYAPTGAGKTAIACKMIADAVSKGKRVIFCVHRVNLIHQTQKTLSKYFGIESAIIWGNHPIDYDNPVQIAMVQTLQHRELPSNIGVVIIDEAHTTSYYKVCKRLFDTYSGGITVLSKCFFIGLSASPWRAKSTQGFCQFFQEVVRAPCPQKLIELGHLCNARQFGYNGLIDYSKLDTDSSGDYTLKSMRGVCTPEFNQEVVTKYLELCPTRKAIAFCSSVAQAQDLASKFCSKGIPTAFIVANTSESEREEIFSKFARSEIQIITSMGVLCEGFDEPSVEAVILARPTRSLALLIQMCGRGLRPYKGKSDCWFVDFCENISHLGHPTAEYEISLCPSYRKPIENQVKECFHCHALVPLIAKICPHCGSELGMESSQEPQTSELPPFGEILIPNQKRQAKYYRKSIKAAFIEKNSRTEVEEKFLQKYKFSPPSEWGQYSVFNHTSKVMGYNKQIYIRYLMQQLESVANMAWVIKMMQIEFGLIEQDIGLKKWWEFFFVPSPFANKTEMDEAYRHIVDRYQFSSNAKDILMQLNLGYDEGCIFYLQFDERLQAKVKILESVKDKPLALAAAYLRASQIEKVWIDRNVSEPLGKAIDNAVANHWDKISV